MKSKIPIKCSCDQQIRIQDIVQMSLYVKRGGPVFLMLRFLCPHCHQYGEAIIRQIGGGKENSILQLEELTDQEREELESRGQITTDELIDFHLALKDL